MIYLDNSATTKPCAEAVEAVAQALTQDWGNPSALYDFGIHAARQLRSARHAVAAAVGTAPSHEPQQHRSPSMRTVIAIDGMHCGHCSASVEKALRAVAGVADVAVSLEEKNAVVTHENASADAMKAAVTEAGFTVTGVR